MQITPFMMNHGHRINNVGFKSAEQSPHAQKAESIVQDAYLQGYANACSLCSSFGTSEAANIQPFDPANGRRGIGSVLKNMFDIGMTRDEVVNRFMA